VWESNTNTHQLRRCLSFVCRPAGICFLLSFIRTIRTMPAVAPLVFKSTPKLTKPRVNPQQSSVL
jgi:hypothetical protein